MQVKDGRHVSTCLNMSQAMMSTNHVNRVYQNTKEVERCQLAPGGSQQVDDVTVQLLQLELVQRQRGTRGTRDAPDGPTWPNRSLRWQHLSKTYLKYVESCKLIEVGKFHTVSQTKFSNLQLRIFGLLKQGKSWSRFASCVHRWHPAAARHSRPSRELPKHSCLGFGWYRPDAITATSKRKQIRPITHFCAALNSLKQPVPSQIQLSSHGSHQVAVGSLKIGIVTNGTP